MELETETENPNGSLKTPTNQCSTVEQLLTQ